MPTLNRKRRAPQADDDGPANAESSTSAQQGRRRRISRSPESDAESYAGSDTGGPSDESNLQLLTKKLVRYALACEYGRQPIKRQDITTKVLGSASRQFKAVFAEANITLRQVFGMEMVELPMREKVTIREKRAAQKSDKAPTSSKSWILASTLDQKYRDPTILQPSETRTAETESAYVGLYTMIVSVIMLNGGTLPEAKLERYLRRANAERTTPVDTTEKLLARLIREGYIVRLKDSSSGEELIDYMVGPRAKVEIGQEGVADLVKTVYGVEAPDDLDKRLDRSLGLNETRPAVAPNGAHANSGVRSKRGRPKKKSRDVGAHDGDSGGDEEDGETDRSSNSEADE